MPHAALRPCPGNSGRCPYVLGQCPDHPTPAQPKRMRGGKLTRERMKLIVQRPLCAQCGRVGTPRTLQRDHILNIAAGGTEDPANIQLLCLACHAKKTKQERPNADW